MARSPSVLAETAERAGEIDVQRAQRARERAEERLRSSGSETDFARAGTALKRAETRIEVAEKRS